MIILSIYTYLYRIFNKANTRHKIHIRNERKKTVPNTEQDFDPKELNKSKIVQFLVKNPGVKANEIMDKYA